MKCQQKTVCVSVGTGSSCLFSPLQVSVILPERHNRLAHSLEMYYVSKSGMTDRQARASLEQYKIQCEEREKRCK